MNEKSAWQMFITNGSVKSYLQYAEVCTKEREENEYKDKGDSLKRESYPRE